MRSICSTAATPSCRSRSASPPKGRPQRFTRNPGPSCATTTVLPIASPASRPTDKACSPVCTPPPRGRARGCPFPPARRAGRCRRPSCRRRPRRGPESTALEFRLALLDEGGHALNAVLGCHRELVEPPLVVETCAEPGLLGGQH